MYYHNLSIFIEVSILNSFHQAKKKWGVVDITIQEFSLPSKIGKQQKGSLDFQILLVLGHLQKLLLLSTFRSNVPGLTNNIPTIISFFYLGVYWSTSSSICGLVGFFFCMLVSFIFGESFCFPESGLERFYIILVGALGFLKQATEFLAVKFESAAIVALLYKAFEVIFSFVLQILIFQVIFEFLRFHNEMK